MDLKKTLFLLVAGAILVIGGFYWGKSKNSISPSSPSQKEIEELATPTLEQEIDKVFTFQASKDEEEEVSFQFNLTKAKKVKLVTTQGEPIGAGVDKEFLVLSLEINNGTSSILNVNSQNYIRLVDGEKKYAPDFYNGVIEVPALSVKKDEVAFVVPAEKKEFNLLIGPIDGEKEQFEINF